MVLSAGEIFCRFYKTIQKKTGVINKMKLLVIIPTYNEIENIESIINSVFIHSPEAHILIIDDNSPDGTAAVVEKIAEHNPSLHILKRAGKQGLAGAYLAGFDWGLSKSYDAFLEMDADFSHNPKYIPEMLVAIQNHDVVIGSRNIKGGAVEGWPLLRNFVSKGGSLYSRVILRCPVKDLTGGFNMWTKNALLKIGLNNILSKGYSFQIEMKYRAWLNKCSIKEIPILFTDRKLGSSKMSKKILFEALLNIWKLKKIAGDTAFNQIIKFGITGGLGSITNLLLFFLLVDKAGLPEIPVSIFCFIVAGTQNYFLNHLWSFRKYMEKTPVSIIRWLMFLAGSLLGLAINITVMELIITHFILPWKFIAQACGIASGMVFNFIISKFIIFRRKKNNV
jgi:dolichol-phosphate mannosyltransferase